MIWPCQVPLKKKTVPVSSEEAAELVTGAIDMMLAAPTTSVDEITFVQQTAAAMATAVAGLAVRSKHEVLVEITAAS